MRDDALDVAAQLVVQALGHLVHRRGHRRPRRVGADGPPGEQDLALGSGAVLDARVLLLDEDHPCVRQRALDDLLERPHLVAGGPHRLRCDLAPYGDVHMHAFSLLPQGPGASAEDHGRGCGELRRAQAPGGTFTEARARATG